MRRSVARELPSMWDFCNDPQRETKRQLSSAFADSRLLMKI